MICTMLIRSLNEIGNNFLFLGQLDLVDFETDYLYAKFNGRLLVMQLVSLLITHFPFSRIITNHFGTSSSEELV